MLCLNSNVSTIFFFQLIQVLSVGHRNSGHIAWVEPGRDGFGVGDGARGKPGAGGVHVDGAIRGDGMRGDGVGVGDVGEVHGDPWRAGHTANGDDGS